MIKILNIVGARPQIIKAAAISRAIKNSFSDQINDIIVHTGQHYDKELSEVFFQELAIPKPDYNLKVGTASHGKQTAAMISGLEDIMLKDHPDAVVVYGDTNSTLAGAVAASKLSIPVIHIEAGLRSYTKQMPEEINRVLCDHVSTLLFAPTNEGFKNLMKEGFRPENSPPYTLDNPKIFLAGDIMYDNSLFYGELAEERKPEYLEEMGLTDNEFVLVTVHRPRNTDNPERLKDVFESILELANQQQMPFVIPLHPRTSKALETCQPELLRRLDKDPWVRIIPPVSFLEMILLEKKCRLIMTDSGGVQKEAHFFNKASIVLRAETEWVELVGNGTAILADANKDLIYRAFDKLIHARDMQFPAFYGDGKAAEAMLEEVLALFKKTVRAQV